MTDDLPTQLRLWASIAAAGHSVEDAEPIMLHAADRIEAQDKRNKELEAALWQIIEDQVQINRDEIWIHKNIARAALGEKKNG